MVAYIALVMFLGLTNAGGLLFVWLLDEIGAGLILASGAVVAVLIARVVDGMHKRTDGAPTSWGIVLVSSLIAVGLVADVRSRHWLTKARAPTYLPIYLNDGAAGSPRAGRVSCCCLWQLCSRVSSRPIRVTVLGEGPVEAAT